MEELENLINRQLRYNRKKNLLCEERFSALGFSPDLEAYLQGHLPALKNMAATEAEAILDHLVHKAVASLCQANQFYFFNSFDRSVLKDIYRKLLLGIRELPENPGAPMLQALAKRHYRSLQGWLKRSNPFVKALYPAVEAYLEEEVVCGEYAAQTQLDLLGLDFATLKEPILDLGCGQQAFLVKHLRTHGLAAFGVDRNVTGTDCLLQADWFEFDLAGQNWGTIISNVGFSNHFQHHHLRIDGDYSRYAIRYMEILQCLQAGGAFYYAPDLPFIEQHLDAAKYKIQKVAVAGTEYSSSRILKKV